MARKPLVVLALTLLTAPAPVRAECLGSCMDGLLGAFIAMAVYGGIGLAVLILLIRPKWRRGGLRLLVATLVIAFGVPLVSQGWQGWRLHGMEGREVAGQPPALQGRVPLLIDDGSFVCGYGPCAPILWSMGEAGAFGLPFAALEGLDLTQPIPLAELPLELWRHPTDGTGVIRSHPLTPAERLQAAGRIDYLVLTRQTLAAEGTAPVEAALRQSPGLAGLRDDELVHLGMAPFSGGSLALPALKFDVLDLGLERPALAFPLAPYNTQGAANATASFDRLLQLFCPADGGMEAWTCRNAFQ